MGFSRAIARRRRSMGERDLSSPRVGRSDFRRVAVSIPAESRASPDGAGQCPLRRRPRRRRLRLRVADAWDRDRIPVVVGDGALLDERLRDARHGLRAPAHAVTARVGDAAQARRTVAGRAARRRASHRGRGSG